MKNRIKLIDVAKGISIILVAFSHSELRIFVPDIHQSMSLFRMPLFFFLSGVFLSVSAAPSAFIAKKSDALLKPYFVTLLIVLLLSMFSEQEAFISKIKGALYGNGDTIGRLWAPLWFLTHLWCLYIASYFLFRYTTLQFRSNAIKTLFVMLMLIVGSLSIDVFWYLPVSIGNYEIELPGLPFSIDIIFISMSYFVAGFFLNQSVKKFKPAPYIIVAATCALVFIATNLGAVINLNKRVYAEPVYATFAAISGIYLVLSISYFLCKSELLTRALMFFGTASLFVLIFHMVISQKTYQLLNYLFGSSYQFFCAFIAFIIAIIVPVFIRKLIWNNAILRPLYFPIKSYNMANKCFMQPKKTNSADSKKHRR